jgi:hypothetical protein
MAKESKINKDRTCTPRDGASTWCLASSDNGCRGAEGEPESAAVSGFSVARSLPAARQPLTQSQSVVVRRSARLPRCGGPMKIVSFIPQKPWTSPASPLRDRDWPRRASICGRRCGS